MQAGKMKLGVLKGHRRNMSKISKKHRHDPSRPQQIQAHDQDQGLDPPTNYNDEEPDPVPVSIPGTVLGREEDSSLSNLGSDVDIDVGGGSGSDCGSGNGDADGSESEFTSLKMDQATCAASATAMTTPTAACKVLSGLSIAKKSMFAAFQPWVLRTYGDSAKTKTITLKKCTRIIKTLNGEESTSSSGGGGGGSSSVENSKFRFWVKTKGFQTRFGRPRTNNNLAHVDEELLLAVAREDNKVQEYLQLKPDLFVPSLVKDERVSGSGQPVEKQVYKRVAIVEQFFDIIHTVHTRIEARNGKHAGQKRTYRAITEKYAFLPREAVTRFLLQCADCQKRMNLGGSGHWNSKTKSATTAMSPGRRHLSAARKDGPGRGLLREPNAAARPVPTPTRRLRECRLKPALIKKAVNTIVRKSKQQQQQHRILPISIAALKRQHAHALTQQKKIANGNVVETTAVASDGHQPQQQQQHHYHRDPLRLKPKLGPEPPEHGNGRPRKAGAGFTAPAPAVDMKYCLPFTTTYLRQQRQNQDQGTQTLKTEKQQERDEQDDEKRKKEGKHENGDESTKHQRQEGASASEKEIENATETATEIETNTEKKGEKAVNGILIPVVDQYEYEYNHNRNHKCQDDVSSSSSSGEESVSASVSSSVRAEANSSSSDEEDEFEDEEEHEKILLGTHNILGHGQRQRSRSRSRSPKPLAVEAEAASAEAESRMVKMSGASGRKRLAPTKVTTGGKVKSSKSGGGNGVHGHGSGVDPSLDSFPLSLKESGHLSGSGSCGGSSGSSADENHEDFASSVPTHAVKAHSHTHSHSKHGSGGGSSSKVMKMEHSSSPVDWLGYHPMGLGKPGATSTPTITNNNSIFVNGKHGHGHEARKQSSPISLTERSGPGHHERERDENSSNGNKDDEDDDDEDSLDKADAHQYDPERLKAFNMFVRLFVDENLDRMVPISKQPKEKIQAIIDSCTRQFPEYAERARKRIRTYLKSCRRNKRIKDGGGGVGVGWESTRPTPAHLTSAQAEQILAQACENESQNAKRMRMGLEPISQPIPTSNGGNGSSNSARLANTNENGCFVSRSSSSTPSPEKILKLSNTSIVHSSVSPSSVAGGGVAPMPLPSPSSTAATISAVVAAAVAASANANSTCSSLSSPSSGISSLSAFSDSGSTNVNSNGAPHINLLSSGSGHHQHNHLVNGSSSSSPTSPFVDSPLMNSTSMSGLSKLVGAERGNHVVDYSRRLNGSAATGSVSMYKPNFCQSLSKPGQFPGSLFSPTNGALNGLNGDAGPTDLSMKAKSSSAAAATALLTQHLNLTELTTVRQLIMGYRESAAFLLRSADELEQLLMQQQ